MDHRNDRELGRRPRPDVCQVVSGLVCRSQRRGDRNCSRNKGVLEWQPAEEHRGATCQIEVREER